ncbi:MAG: chemotaxis protein CheW [Acidobacteriota bacterium]
MSTAVNTAHRPNWLTFDLSGTRYAVAMRQVVRVAEVPALHPLPGDLECNLGVAVHEGVVLGILDLEVVLDMRPVHRRPPGDFTCIFGRFARGVAGFPVDALLGLERSSDGFTVVDLEELEPSR